MDSPLSSTSAITSTILKSTLWLSLDGRFIHNVLYAYDHNVLIIVLVALVETMGFLWKQKKKCSQLSDMVHAAVAIVRTDETTDRELVIQGDSLRWFANKGISSYVYAFVCCVPLTPHTHQHGFFISHHSTYSHIQIQYAVLIQGIMQNLVCSKIFFQVHSIISSKIAIGCCGK